MASAPSPESGCGGLQRSVVQLVNGHAQLEDEDMTYASTAGASTDDGMAIRAIVAQMIDAWNRGSGEGFAAPFAEHADFVAFEGTHLRGRRQIAEFHQNAFDTVVKGTRLEGEARFVRFLTPEVAVMHAAARTALCGRAAVSRSRDSMQLFVVSKVSGRWQVEALLNARQLTLERQLFFDELESLSAAEQQQVSDLVASVRRAQPHLGSAEELPGI
jgi:uncharacterized protein (TIGR02246 family)